MARVPKISRYWFKPQHFGVFAGYYPVTWEGWALTVLCLTLLTYLFQEADQPSHSASDTLLKFAPGAIAVLLFFDLLCFRTGEYPAWWRRKHWFKS